MMIFSAFADGRLWLQGRWVPCALGRGGVVAPNAKIEGDGVSPAGLWPLRRVLFRPDRAAPPVTGLAVSPSAPDDGWCDAPGDPDYNRPVTLPHGASAERLWRHDGLYDLIVVLGYNDAPVRAGAGSAIFLHLARDDYAPTEGCVALAATHLVELLRLANPGDALMISASAGADPSSSSTR